MAAVAIVDLAELPTLQFTPSCNDLARDVAVTVDGIRLHWTVASTRLDREPGAAGLDTTRLTCELTAPATLDRPTDVEIVNGYLPERLGWRELTATGEGVAVTGLPSASVTNQLRSYPDDLLSSPLDVRSAHLRTTPGFSSNDAVASVGTSKEGVFAHAEQWLQNTVGDKGLTPLVGLLAVLLAMVLGAGHAALPGHGKTVMAIYLAGRAGRPRDALMVGATVTATHTGGVLVLGLLLTGAASLAGETVLGWLGIASGALVMAVGGFMLFTTLRRPIHQHHHHHDHHHDHSHTRHHRANLTALGIAGGLVPSPSALIVLLGAIALGRTGFGVLLVLAYGLGMAGTLTIAGLTLLKVRDRLHGRWQRLTRLAPATPYATGGLVLIVGIGLAARAATLVA
ncbi:MAG TPA: High-affinity nickel-transporter [Micromonosporaceae bacterium]|nr:High-affinity nickel-transporter [Micromonosporaceae bacterium]HCU50430.1 High-affinity nickel-transporter [Micromonosporaceae bacterium]